MCSHPATTPSKPPTWGDGDVTEHVATRSVHLVDRHPARRADGQPLGAHVAAVANDVRVALGGLKRDEVADGGPRDGRNRHGELPTRLCAQRQTQCAQEPA